MDLKKILADLRAERDQIEQAILVVQRLAGPVREIRPVPEPTARKRSPVKHRTSPREPR